MCDIELSRPPPALTVLGDGCRQRTSISMLQRRHHAPSSGDTARSGSAAAGGGGGSVGHQAALSADGGQSGSSDLNGSVHRRSMVLPPFYLRSLIRAGSRHGACPLDRVASPGRCPQSLSGRVSSVPVLSAARRCQSFCLNVRDQGFGGVAAPHQQLLLKDYGSHEQLKHHCSNERSAGLSSRWSMAGARRGSGDGWVGGAGTWYAPKDAQPVAKRGRQISAAGRHQPPTDAVGSRPGCPTAAQPCRRKG